MEKIEKEEIRMEKMYEQMEYDDKRPKEAYTADGAAFIEMNEENVYVTHSSDSGQGIIYHRHNSIELFGEEGEAEYKINGEIYTIGKHDILIIGAMDFHFAKLTKVPFNRYGLTMLPVYMRTIPAVNEYLDIYKTQDFEGSSLLKGLSDKEFAEYIHILRHLREETRTPKKDSAEIVSAYIHILTLMLKRKLHFQNSETVRSPLHQTMQQIKSYIDLNYKEEINLEKLGELFYFQPGTISKYFKMECGINIKKYINTVRVSNALRLLEKSDISIEALAMEVGYTNVNTFLRQFNEMMQISPLQYRKKHRAYLKKHRIIDQY